MSKRLLLGDISNIFSGDDQNWRKWRHYLLYQNWQGGGCKEWFHAFYIEIKASVKNTFAKFEINKSSLFYLHSRTCFLIVNIIYIVAWTTDIFQSNTKAPRKGGKEGVSKSKFSTGNGHLVQQF